LNFQSLPQRKLGSIFGAKLARHGAWSPAFAIAPKHVETPPWQRWLARSWIVVLVLALVKATELLLHYQPAARALSLNDPDNYMRLAQIRDWLGGQSWWDVTQYRVDPPHGLHTHWSRLADLPVAAAITLLKPFFSGVTTERLAVTIMPLVLLVAAILLIVRIAEALAGRGARVPAALLALAGVKFQWEFVPGRIDHHAQQIVLLLAALAALTDGERRWHGLVAALAVALALGTGMETAPYLVVIAAWGALRWAARGAAVRDVTLGWFAGLAVLVPAVFAATVPMADWGLAKGDAIGRGHVVAALLLGSALAFAVVRAPVLWHWRERLALVAVIGAAGGAIVLAAFPEVAGKPYDMVGPLLLRLWIAHISETRTVVEDWAASPWIAVARMAFGAAMLAAGAGLAWRSAGVERDRYALLTAIAAVALVLTGWQFRAVAAAAAVAVPLAAALAVRAGTRSLAAAAIVLTASATLLLAETILPRSAPEVRVADANCAAAATYTGIARLPPGLVLSQIDLSGPLLVWTPHSVVASGIHRGYAGNHFAFETWMAEPAVARKQLAARGINYVADCTTDSETRTLASEAPHGLVAALARGTSFAWLQPVAHGGNQALKFYRVLLGAR